MKTYNVSATITTHLYAEVQADSLDEALKIAQSMTLSDYSERLQGDDLTVQTVEESE